MPIYSHCYAGTDSEGSLLLALPRSHNAALGGLSQAAIRTVWLSVCLAATWANSAPIIPEKDPRQQPTLNLRTTGDPAADQQCWLRHDHDVSSDPPGHESSSARSASGAPATIGRQGLVVLHTRR